MLWTKKTTCDPIGGATFAVLSPMLTTSASNRQTRRTGSAVASRGAVATILPMYQYGALSTGSNVEVSGGVCLQPVPARMKHKTVTHRNSRRPKEHVALLLLPVCNRLIREVRNSKIEPVFNMTEKASVNVSLVIPFACGALPRRRYGTRIRACSWISFENLAAVTDRRYIPKPAVYREFKSSSGNIRSSSPYLPRE
jgi:hypothetical protein